MAAGSRPALWRGDADVSAALGNSPSRGPLQVEANAGRPGERPDDGGPGEPRDLLADLLGDGGDLGELERDEAEAYADRHRPGLPPLGGGQDRDPVRQMRERQRGEGDGNGTDADRSAGLAADRPRDASVLTGDGLLWGRDTDYVRLARACAATKGRSLRVTPYDEIVIALCIVALIGLILLAIFFYIVDP
jgi:hypothetical protein